MDSAVGEDVVGAPSLIERPISAPYAWYIVVILTLIATINVVDRQLMSLLAQTTKIALHLTDSELGLVLGPATGLVFAIAGIPIARVADSFSRKWVIAICLLAFTIASVACGAVTNFTQLFAARVAVATGESGTLPASQSLISGLFPRGRTTVPLAVLFGAHCVGTFIAFVAGGLIATLFDWRHAFFVISAPGLLIWLLLVLTVPNIRNPKREAGPRPARGAINGNLRFLWSRPAFRNTTFAFAFYMLGSYSILVWMPAFLTRSFALKSVSVGWIMGLSVGGLGFLGSVALGWIAQRLAARDARWPLWTVALAGLCGTPFLWATLVSHNLPLFLVLGVIPALVCNFHQAASNTIIQALASPSMKSEASALTLLIVSVLAGSIGPLLVGVLSDMLRTSLGPEALRYVFLLLSLSWPTAALFYWRASLTLHRDLATIEGLV
jgi:predicted MFS family arabinose efflux permease